MNLRDALKIWKRPLRTGSNSENLSLYARLKQEIKEIRGQSTPPDRDRESFSRYICDLCHTGHQLSDLRQCVICGRWTCDNCRDDEHYLCNSCRGILNLLMLTPSIVKSESESSVDVQEEDDMK